MAESLDDLETVEPASDSGFVDDIDDLEALDDIDLDDDDLDPDEDEDGSDDKALDELEAEELEMLTEDEAAESLPVDEARELRQIRKATMSLDSAADSPTEGEFVCSNCFLVKAAIQLSDKRKKLCRDCA